MVFFFGFWLFWFECEWRGGKGVRQYLGKERFVKVYVEVGDG